MRVTAGHPFFAAQRSHRLAVDTGFEYERLSIASTGLHIVGEALVVAVFVAELFTDVFTDVGAGVLLDIAHSPILT